MNPTIHAVVRAIAAGLALALLMATAVGAALGDLDDPVALSTTGDHAFKGKIVYLTYETSPGSGVYEKPLVSVFADSPDPTRIVWDWSGTEWPARDIFVTRSLDGGATWSAPVNISNTAHLSSATADDDGNSQTPPLPYRGDCEKPQVFATPQTGTNIVVSWVGAYCDSGVQGSVIYPQSNGIEVPYKCVYVARSTDAGATWTVDRMTDGSRDAKQNTVKGTGAGFVMAWQEDPHGLQPGQGDGPGEGGSGAKASQGTDVWYTAVKKASFASGFPPAVRATDNFEHFDNDGLESGSFRSTRPQVALIGQTALLAYEEVKGLEKYDTGKYVRYHTITPFHDVTTAQTRDISDPGSGGLYTVHYGLTGDPSQGEGWIISKPDENARRVRIISQGQPGPTTGILAAFVYKQGNYTEGGPSDIMLRVLRKDATTPASTGLRPDDMDPPINFSVSDALPYLDHGRTEAFGNRPALNISSNQGLGAGSDVNRLEDARAHRGVLNGDFLAVGYTRTDDQALARYPRWTTTTSSSAAPTTVARRGTPRATCRPAPTPA